MTEKSEVTPSASGVQMKKPSHVDDRDADRQGRRDQDDDKPRSPFGEHERSVQPEDRDDHRSEVQKASGRWLT